MVLISTINTKLHAYQFGHVGVSQLAVLVAPPRMHTSC